MKYLFYLNGEYEKLAISEIGALLIAYSIPFTIVESRRQLLLIMCEKMPFEVISRLALTHRVMEYIDTIKPRVGKLASTKAVHFIKPTSFCVRIKKIDKEINAMEEEKRISEQILSHIGVKIDLKNPLQEINGFYVGGEIFLGKTIAVFAARDFASRKPQHRPYFHPSSIDPRLARALVNLSGARKDVLDPFCGTGGILIEAGLMGLHVYGIDIEEKMVDGAMANLFFYSIEGDVRKGDSRHIGTVFNRKFEAVVTDVPYGKSTVVGDSVDALYKKAFIEISKHLEGKAVIVLSRNFDFESVGFEVVHKFVIRVHRSLERHIYVLKRKFEQVG
ncbi:MAG: DNA methyltransferase [Candidatus Methanofastidiosia archaeon]